MAIDEQLPSRELLMQVMEGSRMAFEQLVGLYEKRIYGYFYSRLNQREDARELTQDVFVSVYRNVDAFDLTRSFDPWIFTIARNAYVSHLRKSNNQAVPLDTCSTNAFLAESDALLAGDDCRYLWSVARKHLSESQYDALWFSCHEGMSVKETAQALGRSPLHAKVLLYRGRRKLFSIVSKESIISGQAMPQFSS